ncbi:MAG: helix-turn-helix transcriptional regulator [Eggerthellaceae bacterium]|nr:helix-turn-helix transcriptional regulator [Eggerthellaceae bacterium]
MGIRVPRITITADYGDESYFGELSVISIGYALHQAWTYSVMFDTGTIFEVNPLATAGTQGSITLCYLVSIIVFGLFLLLASALDARFSRILAKRPVVIGGAALTCVGTLLLLAANGGPLEAPVHVVAGVLTGIGSGVLLLLWGTAFARGDSTSIVLNSAIAVSVAYIFYAYVLHQLPFPFGGILSALIPFAEAAILLNLRGRRAEKDPDVLEFRPLPINQARFTFRFGLPVIFLGLALGILRQTSIRDILPGASSGDYPILLIAACCASILLLLTAMTLGREGRWHSLFRSLIPFIAVAVLFVPFVNDLNSPWSTSVLLVGYMAFETLMWVFFSEISQRFRLSPIFVFGLGRGLLAMAGLAGTLMPVFSSAVFQTLPFGEGTFLLVLIIAMMLAFALLPNENDIAAIVTVGPLSDRTRAAATQVAPVAGDPAGSQADAQDAGADAGRDADEARPATAADDATGPQADAGADEESPLATPEELADEALSPAAPSEPSEARLAMLGGGANASAAGAGGPVAPGDEPDRLRQQCEAIANTYLLSKREAEVMYFLARGFKSSYIQEKLYISEGTAKTHIRHIYRKVNVHSQQELMRLVDAVEL